MQTFPTIVPFIGPTNQTCSKSLTQGKGTVGSQWVGLFKKKKKNTCSQKKLTWWQNNQEFPYDTKTEMQLYRSIQPPPHVYSLASKSVICPLTAPQTESALDWCSWYAWLFCSKAFVITTRSQKCHCKSHQSTIRRLCQRIACLHATACEGTKTIFFRLFWWCHEGGWLGSHDPLSQVSVGDCAVCAAFSDTAEVRGCTPRSPIPWADTFHGCHKDETLPSIFPWKRPKYGKGNRGGFLSQCWAKWEFY